MEIIVPIKTFVDTQEHLTIVCSSAIQEWRIKPPEKKLVLSAVTGKIIPQLKDNVKILIRNILVLVSNMTLLELLENQKIPLFIDNANYMAMQTLVCVHQAKRDECKSFRCRQISIQPEDGWLDYDYNQLKHESFPTILQRTKAGNQRPFWRISVV